MTPTPHIFRATLIASLAFCIGNLCIAFLAPHLIPESMRLAQEALQADASTSDLLGIGALAILAIFLLLAGIVCVFGLWNFKAWARQLNIALTLCAVATLPMLGYTLESGWSSAFNCIAQMLWGALTAMSYCAPVAHRFQAAKP